ncbi:iron-sulfur cluster assembly scaffold protein [Eggerthellaceae bacterium 3-80]|nr:iron-sulfur cluster assembly scaffold protein [bacterium D16-34]
MSEGRDIYHEPPQKVLLRTADVYQTNVDNGVVGYSDTLLAIVANFKNNGIPEGANAQSMVGKSKRGEVAFRLFARIDSATHLIEAAGFKTRGCLAMTGCASAACAMIEGKSLEEALEITTEDIRKAVDGVPANKANTLTFAVEAIRALVGDFWVRQGVTLAELDQRVPCDTYSVACLMCEHCSLRDIRTDMLMAEWDDDASVSACNDADKRLIEEIAVTGGE